MTTDAASARGSADAWTLHVVGKVRGALGESRTTQRALARALGETPTWVNERLLANIAPSTTDLARIAAVLGITPEELITGSGSPRRPDPALDTVTGWNSACAPAPVIPLRRLADAA